MLVFQINHSGSIGDDGVFRCAILKLFWIQLLSEIWMKGRKRKINIDPRLNIRGLGTRVLALSVGEGQRTVEVFDDGERCWRY